MSLGLYAQADYKTTCCSLVMINLNNQQKYLEFYVGLVKP